jgi:hypothetical protein
MVKMVLNENDEPIIDYLYTPKNIYFIQAKSNHLIKIGQTNNIERRLAGLKRMSPVKLRLLGYVNSGLYSEPFLHNKFKESRMHGEWFKPSEELYDFIEKNCIQKNKCWKKTNIQNKIETLENRIENLERLVYLQSGIIRDLKNDDKKEALRDNHRKIISMN